MTLEQTSVAPSIPLKSSGFSEKNSNSSQLKKDIEQILSQADIKINGTRPWDIQVKDERFYHRLMSEGSIGAGESYMDGWWDSEKLDQTTTKLLEARLEKNLRTARFLAVAFISRFLNMQSRKLSRRVASCHYNLGNDFYSKMLDRNMQYTCAYWNKAQSLDEAQEHKLDLVCKKLRLSRGEKVLELGCGWGGFAKFAAENYGCHVTAYNISSEQVRFARKRCQGLPVEIIQSDYRNAKGRFDKIASIGMCEHVGPKNYRGLMELAYHNLKDNGLFLLHTIGSLHSTYVTDAWLERYIFPGSVLPSQRQLTASWEKLLVMEDWHNFGPDYDKTLMAWYEKFNQNWSNIKGGQFDQRFYRMWKYYLLICAGSFRSRKNQLWQVVLSKHGVPGGYRCVR